MDLNDVREKKKWLAETLTKSLKEEFNRNINVSCGIGRGANQDYDFAVRLTDMDDTDHMIEKRIINFAENKIRELVPASKPDVAGVKPSKPR